MPIRGQMRLQSFESNYLNQAKPFVRVIDDNFVISQEIVTDDAIKFCSDCFTQRVKEPGHNHSHVFYLGAAYHEGVNYSGSDSNMRACSRAVAERFTRN